MTPDYTGIYVLLGGSRSVPRSLQRSIGGRSAGTIARRSRTADVRRLLLDIHRVYPTDPVFDVSFHQCGVFAGIVITSPLLR